MKYLIVFVSMVLSFSLNAKPMQLSNVSNNSNWILHIDFESVRSSEIGIFIEDAYENISEVNYKIMKWREKYGLDLMAISNLTIFGSGEKNKGIGILEGGVDASVIFNFARSKDSINEKKLGKNIIFNAEKGRHSMAFSAISKGKIVFGSDSDYVTEGITLSEGKGTGLDRHPIIDSLEGLFDEPFLLLFVNVKGSMEMNELGERASSMISKIDSAGMVIGDHVHGLKLIGLIKTDSIESIEPIENMIRGGLAMLDMKVKKIERMNEMLKGYQVTKNGRQIKVEIVISNSYIIERIKNEMKKAA